MEINDCKYDKVKLLYKFCRISHFIKKHAKDDAKKAGDEKFHTLLNDIEAIIEKYNKQLNDMICK